MRRRTDFYYDQRQNRSAQKLFYRVTPDRSFYSTRDSRVEERNTTSYLSLRSAITLMLKFKSHVWLLNQ